MITHKGVNYISTAEEADKEQELVKAWRWVDEKGRIMTNWKQGDLPPITTISDAKGVMHLELRTLPKSSPTKN